MRNTVIGIVFVLMLVGASPALAIGSLDGVTDPPMSDETPAGVPPSGIFDPSYPSAMSFPVASCLIPTFLNLTFDGTDFWSCSGNSSGGFRLAQYDAAGTEITCYSPGIDFRTVFTAGGNSSPVFARDFLSNAILEQTSPGVFSTAVTLTGGPVPSSQEGAVFNTGATEFVTFSDTSIGEVKRYDAVTGNYLGSVFLSGYGTEGTESAFPQNRSIAAAGGYYLTYSDGNLSAWDGAGNRVGFTQLVGAGTTFDANLSLSFANGKIWLLDPADSTWIGYVITPLAGPAVPTSSEWAIALLAGLLLVSIATTVALARLRRQASPV